MKRLGVSQSATPATRNEATRNETTRPLKLPKVTIFAELAIGTAIATSRGRLRTAADGCVTSCEHSLNPQAPKWNGNLCYAFGKNWRATFSIMFPSWFVRCKSEKKVARQEIQAKRRGRQFKCLVFFMSLNVFSPLTAKSWSVWSCCGRAAFATALFDLFAPNRRVAQSGQLLYYIALTGRVIPWIWGSCFVVNLWVYFVPGFRKWAPVSRHRPLSQCPAFPCLSCHETK